MAAAAADTTPAGPGRGLDAPDWAAADFGGVFKGRRVLLTGHTGFKGGWLAIWLKRLGAEVIGVALPPETDPSFFDMVRLDGHIDHRIGDIRAQENFDAAVDGVDADLVIHMAAQALVRRSYDSPVDTYLTNVVGSAVVLEAARRMPSLRAAIVVTSDKCYENNEWVWPYRENEPMGGSDPYSSSKGCTELVTSAYRRSFFSAEGGPYLASVRAGNVFGGGDWSVDRLVPDIIKAAVAGEPVVIRNPASIRPWQHVLEPLSGYLTLAAKLLQGEGRHADGWNFGPDDEAVVDVGVLSRLIRDAWGAGAPDLHLGEAVKGPHEAKILKLDSAKAKAELDWRPRLSVAQAVGMTVEWYKACLSAPAEMFDLSNAQIDQYLQTGARSET